MTSGSECGSTSTLEITGIFGALNSVDANAASSFGTAEDMRRV
mgnify:FL=1